jgi:hypothetical protein
MAGIDFFDRRHRYCRVERSNSWLHTRRMVPDILLVPLHNYLYGGIHDSPVPGKIEGELT